MYAVYFDEMTLSSFVLTPLWSQKSMACYHLVQYFLFSLNTGAVKQKSHEITHLTDVWETKKIKRLHMKFSGWVTSLFWLSHLVTCLPNSLPPRRVEFLNLMSFEAWCSCWRHSYLYDHLSLMIFLINLLFLKWRKENYDLWTPYLFYKNTV